MFQVCGVSITKHKDGSKARIARDEKDLNCFLKWFAEHDPFPNIEKIISIITGLIGGKNVNPHKAEKVGKDMI